MYLHFDKQTFWDDIHDFVDAFAGGILGHDKHQGLASKLRDPKCTAKKSAKITIIANCVDCGNSILKDLHTIWERGSPVHVSLVNKTCPECQGQSGFHYAKHHSFHA